jgi:hypothetical protein
LSSETKVEDVMNVWSMLFCMFLVFTGMLIWIGYLAAAGNLIAIFTLAVIATLTIFITFKSMDIVYDTLRDRAEQKRFAANMQENMANLDKAFTIQNKALTGMQRATKSLDVGGVELEPEMFKVLDSGLD